MPTLWDFATMPIEEKKKWETLHSSLGRMGNVNYNQCRSFACKNIAEELTKIDVKKGEIIEIPQNIPFHFIGRAYTANWGNNPENYYQSCMKRKFVPCTTICNQNVSHYKGDIFFMYNICPDDIVHIFPMDSDTKKKADREEDLTILPSFWITLSELEEVTKELGVYNQVTLKARRNGQIIRPFAIATFDKISQEVQKIADLFKIGIVILNPDSNAVNYRGDLLYDWFKLKVVSDVMKEKYGFSVESMNYCD